MNTQLRHRPSFRLVSCAAAILVIAGLVTLAAPVPAAAQANPDQRKQTFPAADESPVEPKPAPEGFKVGPYEGRAEFEVGFRVASDVRGNFDMYRSVVNLGEGPRLLNANVSLRAPYGTGQYFDHLDINFNNWGGDPYNNMRLAIGRTDKYEFTADYRNLNYFNYVPTYADPYVIQGLPPGLTPLLPTVISANSNFGQHSMDVSYRTTALQLRLFPNSRISPYVGYSRNTVVDSVVTPSFTTYDVTGNEMVLPVDYAYAADEYRGGVTVSLPRLVFDVEQGYRLMRNDTGVSGVVNPRGNTPVPFVGQTIVLNSLTRGYHDRTSMPFTKAVVKFTPVSNVKFTGRYIYSMSSVDSTMGEIASGNLVNLANQLVYGTALDNFRTNAEQPNHLGSFVAEWTPIRRLTLVDHFYTRSAHTSGGGLLLTTLFNVRTLAGNVPTTNQVLSTPVDTFLAYDRIENQVEAEFDIGHGLVAHAGHRYTDADTSILTQGDEDEVYASLTRQTGIFGAYFTRGQWLRLAFDYEKNSTDGVLTTTNLYNYDTFRLQYKLGSWKHFTLNGRFVFLRNHNPQSDVDWRNHNREYSVSLNYEPTERFYASLDYSRDNLFSDMLILLPATLTPSRSIFDERSQGIGGMFGIGIYRGSRVEFGYRGILNIGSYPLNYHQPFASLTIPLGGHFAYKTYWQYYDYNDKVFQFQGFRRNLVTFALAYNY
jgi:hypothetical protein